MEVQQAQHHLQSVVEHKRTALWIIVVGMIARLAWVLMFPVEPVSDGAAYEVLARTLVEHGVYGFSSTEPSAYWAVGTSAIVAVTYLIFGESNLGVVLTNLAASLVMLVLIYRLGTHYFGRLAGLCALAITALWPNLIMFTSVLSSELYFIALCCAGLLSWENRGRGWIYIILCGLCWGAACYVRPVIVLLPFALALSSWGKWRELAQAGASAIGVFLLILLLVSPWTYRNYQVFGEPVLVSTNFGPNLWMGNNPQTNGRYQELPSYTAGMGEVERSKRLGDEAISYIRESPLEFVWRTAYKTWILHAYETIGVAWNQNAIDQRFGPNGTFALKVISTAYWYGILVLALGAIAIGFRSSGFPSFFNPAILGWAYFTGLHAVIVVDDRYHMSAVPFIALLSGSAASRLAQYVAGARTPLKV